MASPYEKFLSEVRAIRKAKGLTQSEVAKRLKLSRAQYTAIENGRSTMGFVHLYNLSVVLGVQWTIGKRSAP
jgi:transcriptional regulator with XRE-family HTH domain